MTGILPHRPLGPSGLEVSIFALGSWRTFEHLDRGVALATLAAARDAGITFLDDARYNDETGAAPLATGWSEVLFGQLLREIGWDRSAVRVANKLWWERWPEQSPADELDASLERMGFDQVDLVYAMTLPAGLSLMAAVDVMAELLASGRARAWGVGNWTADQLGSAVELAHERGLPAPCVAQLPYSLVRRDWVDDPAMGDALSFGRAGLVASSVLAGGTLSGKYLYGGSGRANRFADASTERGLQAAAPLCALAAEWGIPAAALAVAFALDHPRLSSVLFGATSPSQIVTNLMALDVHTQLEPDQWVRLRQVGTSPLTMA